MKTTDMFGEGNVAFNAFYADDVNYEFCEFNCRGIARLLCCHMATIQDIANKCLPLSATRQIIVIHNDPGYGGAAYPNSNIATTTTNYDGPLVTRHELGHSLFNLGDEYKSSISKDDWPNCDTKGCSKWADLIEEGKASCIFGRCKNGNYYANGDSFMNHLSKPVGHVNNRLTCCTYKFFSNIQPHYCDQYANLDAFCAKNHQGYRNRALHTLSGARHNYVKLDGGATTLFFNLTDNNEYILHGIEISHEPRLYHAGDVEGEFTNLKDAKDHGVTYVVKTIVQYTESCLGREFFVNAVELVVPPPLQSEDEESMAGDVVESESSSFVMSDMIKVVLPVEDNGCKVVGARAEIEKTT